MKSIIQERTALLQRFWLQAHIAADPVVLTFKNKGTAAKVRFDLYNAVKKVRADPALDRELYDAVMACKISVRENEVILQRHEMEDGLLEAAILHGIDPGQLTAAPESRADLARLESEKKLADLLGQASELLKPSLPGHVPNRFFDRTKG